MGITGSVGRNGLNQSNDVTRVQTLLNQARLAYPQFKLKQEPLKIGPLCDDATIEAIGIFQKTVLNHNNPDKLVEPSRPTWRKLNQNIVTKQQLYATSALKKYELANILTWYSAGIPANLLLLAKKFYDELDSFLSIERQVSAKSPGATQSQKDVKTFRQGDMRWGTEKLGFSKKGSIHAYGCALTSLTMAATYLGSPTKYWGANLTPQQLTPLAANDILKKANAFTAKTYMLYLVGGAKALGMIGTDSGVAKRLASSARNKLDDCLNKGGLILAHVDYKKSWKGDHWVLITERVSGGVYKGIDPAYGKVLTLFTSPDENQKSLPNVILYGRASSFVPKTPEKVKKYKVVRFVTLQRG